MPLKMVTFSECLNVFNVKKEKGLEYAVFLE